MSVNRFEKQKLLINNESANNNFLGKSFEKIPPDTECWWRKQGNMMWL
jgi:hypothetical protein